MTTSSHNQPRIYLDIDGVIIVENSPFATEDLNSIEKYAPEVVNRLGATGLDVVLLSTWGDEATLLSRKIEALKNANILPVRLTTIDTKKDALIADQERSPSPFVWADDMINPSVRRELANRLEVPYLLVQPDTRTGLTVANLEEIEDFAARYQTGRRSIA